MVILKGDELEKAQSIPQIERFVGDQIYVIEAQEDYAELPADLKAMVATRMGIPEI